MVGQSYPTPWKPITNLRKDSLHCGHGWEERYILCPERFRVLNQMAVATINIYDVCFKSFTEYILYEYIILKS